MNTKVLNRWLIAQALLWLVLLASLAMATVDPLPDRSGWASYLHWPLAAVGLGLSVSFAALWVLLGVGRMAADWVTLTRFLLISSCCAVTLAETQITWALFTGLVIGVCCDLLDGHVARRFGASEEGAVFDMETDQLVTLALAITIYATGKLGAWILIVPAFRYAYIFYVALLGFAPHDPKPREGDNSRGRLICALMLSSLLTALLPCMPGLGRTIAGIVAILLLTYSFGADMIYLAQRRLRGRAAAAKPSG